MSAITTLPAPVSQLPLTKRLLDVVGALLCLALVGPIIIAAALAVRCSDGGPAFFRQVRVGAGGRRFAIVKLRSMRADAEDVLWRDPELRARYVANDYKLDSAIDPRVTPLGRFLRSTSLDELPQLWNVLRGDMSLVGPRPVLPQELDDRYGAARHHYLATRPGITGVWQVSGRSDLDYATRISLDQHYVEHWSLGRDLRILAATPVAVLTRRGAS